MEGNYRIVQLSDNEFVIEKEIVNIIKFPWWTFKKPLNKTHWRKVDQKGNPIEYGFLVNGKSYYKTSDLKVCQHRLQQIKKYPLIIDYA